MTALVGLGGGGIKQKGKRTHGHGQWCGDCGGEGGRGEEEEGLMEINGNGKKYN